MENKNKTNAQKIVDQPAFPCKFSNNNGFGVTEHYSQGLTKREYFAALAMQAIVARAHHTAGWYESEAKQCVHIADSLINELNKQ